MWYSRSFAVVPRSSYAVMVVGLLLQLGLHGLMPAPQARLQQWPEPLPTHWLRLCSLGEPVVLAKGLMLWLQAFDYQAGLAVTLPDLGLQRLEGWLGNILDLDPRGQYPLVAAVRYYGDLAPPEQQRRLGAFVYRRFFEDPQSRWPWLAHAAITAKHRLNDLPLALRYAQAIRRHVTAGQVPAWATQMEIVILEDMGEWQAARSLVQALLVDGTLQDPWEIRFWQDRMHHWQKKKPAVP